jgi:beta-glucosidase
MDYISKAKILVAEMTLEEKALLLSGDGWWKTHAIDRLQIPSICMTDGPHGLRKVEGAGLSTSVPATCFPTASALASSWDTELIRQVGVALAQESQASGVQILLGPGVNMKRSPLGGRNFEYFLGRPPPCG